MIYAFGRAQTSNTRLCILLLILLDVSTSVRSEIVMAGGENTPGADVHIVYTECPLSGEEPEALHIRTLASVLGSEDAARDALLYSYKAAVNGFSARLTPQQVAEISKKPEVVQVVPSGRVQLHSGSGTSH